MAKRTMGKYFLLDMAVAMLMFGGLFAALGLFLLSDGDDADNVSAVIHAARASVAAFPDVKPTADVFNILLIPGHDVDDGGACYKDYCERDLTAEVAAKIAIALGNDSRFKVTVARDGQEWNPILRDYFANEKQAIIDWKTEHQQESKALMDVGKIKYVPDMAFHSEATPEMSVKLYGMNKWADENGIDLVINLHFNDSMRPKSYVPGGYKGFTIFIPESQMKNHAVSKAAASSVFKELKSVEAPELDNLLEDQSLIALGASGTLEAASMLVEYAYIYEKKLESEATREQALEEFAQMTAAGIVNYANETF
ncbi:MAG: N-acetylmuramoyl-L-alanine amidase [Candidatus Pacebacteria bacterium]|nr:N-acetylmuramoyl-L-alanine amidase [Candidatus Paceibacterota bacterium]